MARSSVRTRGEQIYAELRQDILNGGQRPGARLPFAELASRYAASMGVIREALTRLTAEGLVESEAQYGYRVKAISPDDLAHLTEARCAIETLVLRQAFEHGGVAWESQVLAAHHRLERTGQTAVDDPEHLTEAWATAHADFHLALLSGCPNPRLLSIAQALRDSAELYRRWSAPLDDAHRDVAGEHRAMLDAVLAHRVDDAAAVLVAHIQYTTHVLLEHTQRVT